MIESDAQLVERVFSGDDSSFDELVSRYRTRVYHLALSMVRSRDTASDLAQEAFVQAYVRLRTLRDTSKFSPWLYSITANICRGYLRKSSEVVMPAEAVESLNHPGEQTPKAELDASIVRELIDSLPDGARSAAVLFFLEDMKLTEIANYLDISLPAVKSRVREARIRLQKEMIDMVKHTDKKDIPGDEFSESLKHRLELARYYRDMSDMFEKGNNLRVVLHNLENSSYSREIKDATSMLIQEIENGSTISEALKNLPALNAPGVIGMIRSGEVGGVLDWTVKALADWIEVENSQRELELIYWCRTVGAVSQAGAPDKMVLECGIELARSKGLKQATKEIIDALDAGESLIPVMDIYSDVFPLVVKTAVMIGEKAGSLSYALSVAADTLASGIVQRLAPRGTETPKWWVDAEFYRRKEAFDKEAVNTASSESAYERASAASILAHVDSKNAPEALVKLLEDDDPNVQVAAIRTLVDIRYGDIPDNLLKLTDPQVRRMAVWAAGELNLRERISDVASAVADPDASVSRTAVTSLIKMGDTEILARKSAELLASESGSIRQRAAWVLRNFPTPRTEDALIKVLDDENYIVIEWSALALWRLGRREGLEKLIRVLDSSDGWIALRCAAALIDMGDPSVLPHIKKAVDERRVERREWVVKALG